MKLVKLSCPNCGAKIEANDELKKATCNYCGQTFAIDDEIIKVKHSIDNSKEELENAYTYLEKIEDYDEAYNLFLGLSKKYASKPKVWLGLLKSYTRNFNELNNDSKVEYYYENYIKLESNTENKEKIEKEYNEFLDRVDKKNEELANKEIKNTVLIVLLTIANILLISVIITYFQINN